MTQKAPLINILFLILFKHKTLTIKTAKHARKTRRDGIAKKCAKVCISVTKTYDHTILGLFYSHETLPLQKGKDAF